MAEIKVCPFNRVVTSNRHQQRKDAYPEVVFCREYWTGDSRDGNVVNGDGYHYYIMSMEGQILEAYEMYELDDGSEIVSPLPEMKNVHWLKDLGFEDWEVLDEVKESEFFRIKDLTELNSAV